MVALEKAFGLVGNGWLKEEELVNLASYASSPRQVLIFCNLLSRAESPERGFAELETRIAASYYGMKDWLAAMEAFLDTISRQGGSTSLSMALGYISCCAESQAKNPVPQPLETLVVDMLEKFGFDG